MRRHLRLHVLAILSEPDVHEDDRVEGVTTFPRGHRGMCGLAAEREVSRDGRALDQAVVRLELIIDVIMKCDIDIIEQTIAHEIRTTEKLLLGRCAEDLQRPRQLLALHRIANCNRRRDHDGAVEIVSLAVPRRIGHNLLTMRDA